MREENGNVLFLILIAVALFAVLSYATTQSNRGSGDINDEQEALDKARLDQYQAAINTAVMRLTMGKCDHTELNFETPDGENANPNAPSDGSCDIFSPSGGGVAYQDFGLGGGCDLQSLDKGMGCNGVAYAGVRGGKRLYTTASDSGYISAGSGYDKVDYNTNNSDGADNTDKLLNGENNAMTFAAQICRNLGPEWFLPSINEIKVFSDIQDQGSTAGTFEGTFYMTSSENGAKPLRDCFRYRVADDYTYGDGYCKYYGATVRCMRTD